MGQLYLDGGRWNGRQIISESWVQQSTRPQAGNDTLGYFWWMGSVKGMSYYYASGFGDQRIVVFPSLQMVVVLTQHHYRTMEEGEKLTQQLLENIISTIATNV